MKGIYCKPLNILSCAVQGRPGRSAYEAAVAAGYSGTAEQFAGLLAGLPEAMTNLRLYNGRVDAILEQLDNRVSDLEVLVDELLKEVEGE